ncbi:arabinogalactan oligomer/maltooligosaccharide transport system substrate-binding protein [Actinoplanes octamycinicus]|uniref:Arabinogalactan oligomer/maltooligosaccharide transport system substrate-binding protein n=1 Tax=Actinoplanes octamycinicus TaxID=135948 RepID=A0A7W7MCS0_9ACTN|nr:maltose ABC transporter substrate-binding protein [Actinoplanes octamycinicus]MBB4745398.1 arabinogalactan oligomer/maltooligosaccharide transport system substrate-binding protein [Actinoplanes octamycinicus]GIE56238.1 sugar ABC transporter substrate-binding protein [Actinoplanes octamycinicus]
MRIRTAGVIAASMLCLAGVAACGDSKDNDTKGGSAPSAAAAGGELVIWADDKRSAALKPFAEKFGKENGVTVKVQAISKDQQTTFLTASQQGSGPDVMVGAHDWIGNLVQNGAIDPVQLTAEQKSGIAENAIKAVTFNGQTYGVPYATENLGLIRNTDLAPAAPATIEDLVTAGKKLKAEKKVSEILCLQVGQNGDAYHSYPLYTSAGGYLFGTTANGDYDPKDLGVGKPESVAAFKKLAALGEKGDGALKRSISDQNSIATFTGKKCAYLVSGPWAVTDVKKANIKYDITAVPGFAGGKPATPFLGVQTFYVAAKGKNKALAQEFVTNYVTTPDLAVALYNAEPRPPALTAALDQVKGADADLEKWVAAGKNAVPLPAIPAMAAIWDPFGKAESAVIGGADPEKTITAAGKTISSQIK